MWSGGLSAIFFLVAHKFDLFRMSEKDELIGGDLHYFGPRELDVPVACIDLRTGINQEIQNSA